MKCILAVLLSAVSFFAQVNKPDDTLPVELIYFEAFSFPDSVQLKWGTATELMNYGFEIQRSSASGQWDILGFVPGHGTSFTVHHYTFADTSAVSGSIYDYRMRQIDNDGQFKFSDTITVNYVTSINEISSFTPAEFSVSQNFPNPFNPSTNIEVKLSASAHLKLEVYNIAGRLMYGADYGEYLPGTYLINIDGRALSSGVYIYKISGDTRSVSKTMLLIK